MNGQHSRYSTVAIAFHWTIAVLIIVNLALGLGHDSFGKANVGFIMGVHKSIGLLVLVLSLARLGWRLAHPVPPLPTGMPGWQILLARTTHYFFYVAIILLPLSGWLMSSASPTPRPLTFFWLFDVPLLPIGPSREVAGFWHETHEILGFVTIGVLALHIAGALKHHLIDHDDVLVRMLPQRKAS